MTATTSKALLSSRCVVADDVDAYSGALPGLHLDVVRTGAGFGANTTQSVLFDDVTLSSGQIGFPVLGRTNVAEDRVIAALVTTAPPGSRWCDMDLEPGTVLLYGSGAEHTGVDPAGLEFVFTTVELDSLNETASHLELRQPSVPRGHVYTLAPVAEVRFLATVLQSIQAQLFSDGITAAVRRTTVEALAVALSPESSSRRVGGRRTTDDFRIVRRCIEYSETVNRHPSMTELSHAAFVSVRRLRDAFTNLSGLPPHKYFRRRALNDAHQRLASGTAERETVSRVAMDLGFYNLGRFARQYADIHGEAPSVTLASAPR